MCLSIRQSMTQNLTVNLKTDRRDEAARIIQRTWRRLVKIISKTLVFMNLDFQLTANLMQYIQYMQCIIFIYPKDG